MKIGILGGTFNPIHIGHIQMAIAAHKELLLDEIWIMPSKNPPHKNKSDIVSDEHRTRMINKAIEDFDYMKFSDIELMREGTTYTIDTLKELEPGNDYYFIIGGDSLYDFQSWHKPEQIGKYATIVVFPRIDYANKEYKKCEKLCDKLSRKYNSKFILINSHINSVSSKSIREKLANNIDIYGLCDKKIIDYIYINKLYSGNTNTNFSSIYSIRKKLEATLKNKRYEHTLGVWSTAKYLAKIYKIDSKKAEIAALLHDCAKYLTEEEMYKYCKTYDINLSDIELSNPALVHQKLGAIFAKTRYGIDDKMILDAIECHTTGKPNMTMLEKIIYIADYIEPGRDMHTKPFSLKKIRKKVVKDIDAAILMTLENQIFYLKSSNLTIDSITVDTYSFYKKK